MTNKEIDLLKRDLTQINLILWLHLDTYRDEKLDEALELVSDGANKAMQILMLKELNNDK